MFGGWLITVAFFSFGVVLEVFQLLTLRICGLWHWRRALSHTECSYKLPHTELAWCKTTSNTWIYPPPAVGRTPKSTVTPQPRWKPSSTYCRRQRSFSDLGRSSPTRNTFWNQTYIGYRQYRAMLSIICSKSHIISHWSWLVSESSAFGSESKAFPKKLVDIFPARRIAFRGWPLDAERSIMKALILWT